MSAGRAEPPGLPVPSPSQTLPWQSVALAARRIPAHGCLQASSSMFPPAAPSQGSGPYITHHVQLCPRPSPCQQLHPPTCIPQAGAEGMAKGET